MKAKELMVRERGQRGPVAQADDDNEGFARRSHGRPPPPRAYVYEAQVHGLVVENERIHRITVSGQRELQPANMWLRKLSNYQEG
jgi:hypothetical protein